MNKNSLILFVASVFFCVLSYCLYSLAPNKDARFDLDSPTYERIGQNFSENNHLVDPFSENEIPTPALGYPLFLGILYKLFGSDYFYIIFIQIILSLVCLFLLYKCAKTLLNEDAALFAVILGSLNLGFFVYAQFFLTETLLITFLIAGFERLLNFFKTKQTNSLLQAGILYGISVIVKPAALFYVFILFFFIGLYGVIKSLPVVKLLGLFACCFYVPVIGYMVHNKMQFGVLTVAPLMYENMYYFFLGELIAKDEQIIPKQAFERIEKSYQGKKRNDSARWITAKEMLNNFIYNRPFFIVRIWMLNMIKTLFGLYANQLKFLVNPQLKGSDNSFFSKKGSLGEKIWHYVTEGTDNKLIQGLALWNIIFMAFQYFFVIIALILLLKQKCYFLLSFFVTSISYFVFITGPGGCARYRMLMEYYLVILAALGIMVAYQYVRNRRFSIDYQSLF
jgi:4-amino-4-deoxy-L-arabinose transferase-like glycosyltransferase